MLHCVGLKISGVYGRRKRHMQLTPCVWVRCSYIALQRQHVGCVHVSDMSQSSGYVFMLSASQVRPHSPSTLSMLQCVWLLPFAAAALGPVILSGGFAGAEPHTVSLVGGLFLGEVWRGSRNCAFDLRLGSCSCACKAAAVHSSPAQHH